MDKKQLSTLFEEALHLDHPEITEIRRTPGGMTNDSYFVTVNGEKYVVRIPGKGTDELMIDRNAEKNNLIFGTKLGINPELFYFDTKSGIKITRKLEDCRSLTPEMAREGKIMKKIIALFQRLHFSEAKMKNRFDLFGLMEHYEGLVQDVHPFMMEKIAKLKEEALVLKKVYEQMEVREAPCHIDTAPSNFLLDQNEQMYLIDWEYSGMFDPMWDLATLFERLGFTKEEELFFLKHYFERDPSEEEGQRILLHKIFQDYLWSLWTIYKEAKGEDFGSVAMERIERAMRNIEEYHSIYGMDIVV